MLTKKQQTVLKALEDYCNSKGRMPTVRELQEYLRRYDLNLKSTRSITQYLESLEDKNLISRSSQPRDINIKRKDNTFNLIPIYGMANAGSPTFLAEQNIEGHLKVSKNITDRENVFAIEVEGDSMDQAGIPNGSFVLVDPDGEYRNGDMVLAVIDNLATVKIFRRISDDKIGLFPDSSNKEHKPIYLSPEDEAVINGKVIQVLEEH